MSMLQHHSCVTPIIESVGCQHRLDLRCRHTQLSDNDNNNDDYDIDTNANNNNNNNNANTTTTMRMVALFHKQFHTGSIGLRQSECFIAAAHTSCSH
jgi:hypothetical protein